VVDKDRIVDIRSRAKLIIACASYIQSLTMGFIDDDNLVCQIDAKSVSCRLLEQKIIWQGHQL
jgi:hypothetical protein